MRTRLIIVPLLLGSSPVFAQAAAPVAPYPAIHGAGQEMQRVLNDPAMVDRLAGTVQAMSRALLDLPAGEIRAAAEGRKPTPAETRMTVRDMARRDDPHFDRDFQQRIAQAKPMVQQSMKALANALPGMMQGLQQAGNALERAAANMPDPTYPKR